MSIYDAHRKAVRSTYRAQLDRVHDLIRLHADAALAASGGNITRAAATLCNRLEADTDYQQAYEFLERLEGELAELEADPYPPSRNPKRRKLRRVSAP
jgi:hypothetical protein